MYIARNQIRCTSLQLYINHKTIFNVLIMIFLLYHKFFHLTDGYSCCCAHAFIPWVEEVFITFIHINITTKGFLFLFWRAQSLLFALNIVCNQSFFIFICIIIACSRSVDALQFLILPFFTCQICFADAQLKSFGTYQNTPLAFNYLRNLFY